MDRHRIIGNIAPLELTPTQVGRQLKGLLNHGYKLQLAGLARHKPDGYLLRTRPPRHKIELFGVDYYLSDIRRDDGFRFFVAYLVMPQRGVHRNKIFPRIFYKDSSLIWRSASHMIKSEHEHWVGKGDVKPIEEGGATNWYSAEETTNLPFEIDAALDAISRRADTVKLDNHGLVMVLRNAPDNRVTPYADFSGPRHKAMLNPRQRINNNRDVAWFDRSNDPSSLRFETGFEPDMSNGLVDTSESWSKLYGGKIVKYRIASANRKIQYMFIVAPVLAWIVPPQPLNTELMSYGVRTVDANAAEDLCVPGYEFHYLEDDEDPTSLVSQIPAGFVGQPSDIDPDRADASAWIEKLPVMKEFRRLLQAGRLGVIALSD